MISLDWKERLKLDTEDFVNRKLAQKNYDIDIVYNAYPKRVDNKVPAEVITYVAKILCNLIRKNIDEYIEFFDYLWFEKGENGRLIFFHLLKKALVKNPELFIEYLKNKLADTMDISDLKALIKTMLPVVKKNPKKYIDTLYNWLKIDNRQLHQVIVGTLLKIVKDYPELAKYVFQKMEREWLYPSQHTIRDSGQYLKELYKIDPEYYFSIYETYNGSRNPVFVEILCEGLNPISEEEYHSRMEGYLKNWSISGNVRIKKAALSGLKVIKKKK